MGKKFQGYGLVDRHRQREDGWVAKRMPLELKLQIELPYKVECKKAMLWVSYRHLRGSYKSCKAHQFNTKTISTPRIVKIRFWIVITVSKRTVDGQTYPSYSNVLTIPTITNSIGGEVCSLIILYFKELRDLEITVRGYSVIVWKWS